MKSKLAHFISREELDEVLGEGEAAPVEGTADAMLESGEATEVTEQVVTQEEEELMDEAMGEATETADTIAEVGETQDAAEEVVEEQSERLESEDPITPAEAAVATEALRDLIYSNGLENSRRFKDFKRPEGKGSRISISSESLKLYDSNPKLSYQLSREGFKDVAKAMGAAIVALFKKLAEQIKALMATVLVWANSNTKTADGLAAKAKKLSIPAGTAWTEDEAGKWKEQLAVLAFINGGKIDAGLSKATELLDGVSNPEIMTRISGAATAVYHDLGKDMVELMAGKGPALVKQLDKLVKEKSSEFEGDVGAGDFFVYGFTGTTVKGLAVNGGEAAVTSLKLSADAVSKFTVEFPSTAGMVKALEDASVIIAGTKKFADAVNQAASEIAKAAQSGANSASDEDKEKAAALKKADKLARAVGQSVATQTIDNLVRTNRAVISYCNAAIKKIEGVKAPAEGDKKEGEPAA